MTGARTETSASERTPAATMTGARTETSASERTPAATMNGAVVQLRSSIGSAPSSNVPGTGAGPDELEAPIRALAELGMDTARIPIDWARVEPRQGQFDGATLDAYDRVFESAPIPLWVTLMEGDVPQWFDDSGNFADAAATARYWPRFVEHVADRYGDRVAGWVPFERPVQFARAAFGDGKWPPRRRDPKAHAAASANLLEAWRDAWTILRGTSPVLMSMDLQRIDIPSDPDEAEASRRWDHMVWKLWPTARRDGVIDIPAYAVRRVEALASSGDGVAAWLPAPGPDAEWIGELLRRLDELIDCPIDAVVRLANPEHNGQSDHVRRCHQQIDEARHDGIDICAIWASPAMGRNGLLDSGSTPLPAADDWISSARGT
jgi:hypothetical protein